MRLSVSRTLNTGQQFQIATRLFHAFSTPSRRLKRSQALQSLLRFFKTPWTARQKQATTAPSVIEQLGGGQMANVWSGKGIPETRLPPHRVLPCTSSVAPICQPADASNLRSLASRLCPEQPALRHVIGLPVSNWHSNGSSMAREKFAYHYSLNRTIEATMPIKICLHYGVFCLARTVTLFLFVKLGDDASEIRIPIPSTSPEPLINYPGFLPFPIHGKELSTAVKSRVSDPAIQGSETTHPDGNTWTSRQIAGILWLSLIFESNQSLANADAVAPFRGIGPSRPQRLHLFRELSKHVGAELQYLITPGKRSATVQFVNNVDIKAVCGTQQAGGPSVTS
ncbi:hypothetical protein Landi51_04188 [Colletotrichum acutatum]